MKFLLISNHRSGTKILRNCLNHVDGIHVVNEMLRSAVTQNKDAYVMMDDLFQSEEKHGILGLDVKYSHMSNRVFEWIDDNKPKIVQLIRRDMLETMLWQEHNVKGRLKGGMGPPLTLVDLHYEANIPNLITALETLKQNITFVRKMADFVVYYEDDLTGGWSVNEFHNKKTRKKLLKFFGKADQRLPIDEIPGLRKNKRKPIRELIKNYNEMMEAIEKSNLDLWYED